MHGHSLFQFPLGKKGVLVNLVGKYEDSKWVQKWTARKKYRFVPAADTLFFSSAGTGLCLSLHY